MHNLFAQSVCHPKAHELLCLRQVELLNGGGAANFGSGAANLFPLSGPLDRLNAILSLLQPLDRYRAPSAIGSAIGRPLSRPISHPRTGRSPQPPRSKPLRGAQPRDSGAIVSQTPLKQARNENAIEAAILNRVLDRD